MLYLKSRLKNIHLITGIIPLVFSTVFAVNDSWLVFGLCILSLFMVVGTVPFFRKRESLYMFIIVAITGIPVNISLCCDFISNSAFLIEPLFYRILCSVLLFCALFSTEEIAFGLITRLIWKRQYKLKIQ